MRKIIAMSIFALGSLTMFASEKTNTVKTETKIELSKEDQIKVTCYHFQVYKRPIINGVPQSPFLFYEEFGLYDSYENAQNRMSEIEDLYPNNSTSFLYLVGFSSSTSINCFIVKPN